MIILFYLALTIAFIITSAAKYKIHPFLVLIFASLIMGFMGGLEPNVILKTLSEGFGNTLKSIGIIIAGGSIIGVFLEKTRAAQSIAEKIVKIVGDSNSSIEINNCKELNIDGIITDRYFIKA